MSGSIVVQQKNGSNKIVVAVYVCVRVRVCLLPYMTISNESVRLGTFDSVKDSVRSIIKMP